MLEARRGANGRKESRAGGQKIVEKTTIVIENHRFDYKNRAMLRLCWKLAAERMAEKNPGRVGKNVGKNVGKIVDFDGGEGVYS